MANVNGKMMLLLTEDNHICLSFLSFCSFHLLLLAQTQVKIFPVPDLKQWRALLFLCNKPVQFLCFLFCTHTRPPCPFCRLVITMHSDAVIKPKQLTCSDWQLPRLLILQLIRTLEKWTKRQSKLWNGWNLKCSAVAQRGCLCLE